MKKLSLPLLLLCLAIGLQAQVKFSLSLLADQETYLVSMLSEKDIPAPMNIASNIQVVLKIPAGEPFLAGNIQSQIAGIDWTDNAFAKQSNSSEDYGLCAFVMVQSMTKAITFEADKETPLFTFKNIESGCVGALSLPENQDREVGKAVARGYNFTQNITLLATRGNAFSGIINKVADCNQLSTSIDQIPLTQNLTAYPVPSTDLLTVEWSNPTSFKTLQLDLIGTNGQHLKTIPLAANAGPKKIQLELDNYPSGLYHFVIKNDLGEYQQHQFIVVDK